jgi:hypothetical protein
MASDEQNRIQERRISALPSVVAIKLRQFKRRKEKVLVLRGLGESLSVFGVGLLVVVLLEWMFRPQLPARAWLTLINVTLALGWLVWRAGIPLLKVRTLRQVALEFEDASHFQFQERIVSAVELAESQDHAPSPGVSPWMINQTIRLAADDLESVDAGGLVDPAPARRAWKTAVGLVTLLVLACLLPGFWPRAWLALNPYSSIISLSHLQLAVTPGHCRLSPGTPLEIKVLANEPLSEAKTAIVWEDGLRETVSMNRSGTNEFTLRLLEVGQGFRYVVSAEDARSGEFIVEVQTPPRLARIQLSLRPPSYTGWTNRTIEGGSADFLLGTEVRLLVETVGELVADADWLGEGTAPLKFKQQDHQLLLDLQPTNSVTYRIRFTGANHLQLESAEKWSLRPVPDEPPSARLAGAGTELGIVQRDELLALEAMASDDVGLKRVDLVVLGNETQADVKELFVAVQGSPTNQGGAEREFKSSLNYNLADLELVSGEEVRFQLVAMDLRDQIGRSEPIALSIGSPDKSREVLAAARLKQLGVGAEEQLDRLRQMRADWVAIERNFKTEDPAAQQPALSMLRGRLRDFTLEVDAIGLGLVAESETNELTEARFLYRLGSTISTWGRQQREVLDAVARQLEPPNPTNSPAVFSLGREFFGLAQADLAQFRRMLAVGQGAFETDVLATRCEAAQGRYKRGLPILRGQTTNVPPLAAAGPGLLATFFEGTTLDGRILQQKVDNPRFDNYAPANRRENWSARYEGELQLPEPGDWTLACVADDGVRLILQGKSILPREAWSPHAATEYKASRNLPAVWIPIVIEFFQGSSESKLRFLAAKAGQNLQEVPAQWLRRTPPRPTAPVQTDPAVNALVQKALKERVQGSLETPAAAPPSLQPLTNLVRNENLTRLVGEKLPVSESLTTNLKAFATWKLEDTQLAETQADNLTGFSKEAQRLMREELERVRWRYEGAAALKEIQNAVEELREINQEERQQPDHRAHQRSESEQAKIDLAKAWEENLARSTVNAAHQLFETAKRKQATLAERTLALKGSAKADTELQPAIRALARALNAENLSKNDWANRIDKRLEEVAKYYRELNELQEGINREEVAAEARQALPTARAFERAQRNQDNATAAESYAKLHEAAARVEKAQFVSGDYQGAHRLQSLAADSPLTARGKETADELRGLAMRTDNQPPSLAQSIPPPMRQQTEALERQQSTAHDSAERLAWPRLALSVEASRLYRANDRKASAAYGLLGQDLGGLLESPQQLTSANLRPLSERAAALAGQKGEEARQAEIRSAEERLQKLARNAPRNPATLAAQLDELSGAARQAAGNDKERAPLIERLGAVSGIAPPVANWTESTQPEEVAASAAHESQTGIQAAPKAWASYNEASEILADAARQIRLNDAADQVAQLDPYPAPPEASPDDSIDAAHPVSGETVRMDGAAGQVVARPAPEGVDQADWSRLREGLRQAIRNSGIEHFSEEQQVAIRAYFERLSLEK